MNFLQNRELSWLRFDQRVLEEATDETVPLLERLKFVSIFTSNLDEFFMIRVGSLFDLRTAGSHHRDSRSGMTPGEQLDAIYAAVRPLYAQRETICAGLETQLRAHGVSRLTYDMLTPAEHKFVRQYFKKDAAPVLSPQIVDTHHPFPHLKNNALHVGAWVRHKGREVFAVVPLPEALPPVLFLPGDELRYIHMEHVILAYLGQLFPNYTILEKTVFRVTRNADINADDEAFEVEGEDFRKQVKKALRQRRRMAPVRLELSDPLSARFLSYLLERLDIRQHQVYTTSAPLSLEYAFSLAARMPAEKRAALSYPPHTPCAPADIRPGSMIRQIQKRDRLLSYPYESMGPFVSLLQEAAADPAVVSIKMTIYRLASKAKLVEALCAAAENGKDVTVLIELRARFDEQNNIDWSERLEDAGCTVLYGFEQYKVHAKVCLITRRERGEIQYITQVGTGNYNEKTAAQYTDLSLMTADRRIGRDADDFFKNMAIGNLEGRYELLLAAPATLKPAILRLMDQQIALGSQGRILLKVNSITDIDVIEKLKEASCAGVTVDLIVRGICCILPGVPERTEHVRVVSIVGRFLEHSRIYVFGSGEAERVYISSADFMTRNTQRRVEVAVPILDAGVRQKIHHILDLCLADNTKARLMQPDGSYVRPPVEGPRVCCQERLLAEAKTAAPAVKPERALGRLRGWIQGKRKHG